MGTNRREHWFASELRKMKHATPFSPFRIQTDDGNSFTIESAEHFIISRRGDETIFYPREEEGHHALMLQRVLSLEPVRKSGRR